MGWIEHEGLLKVVFFVSRKTDASFLGWSYLVLLPVQLQRSNSSFGVIACPKIPKKSKVAEINSIPLLLSVVAWRCHMLINRACVFWRTRLLFYWVRIDLEYESVLAVTHFLEILSVKSLTAVCSLTCRSNFKWLIFWSIDRLTGKVQCITRSERSCILHLELNPLYLKIYLFYVTSPFHARTWFVLPSVSPLENFMAIHSCVHILGRDFTVSVIVSVIGWLIIYLHVTCKTHIFCLPWPVLLDLNIEPTTGNYYPTVFFNEFWLLREKLIAVNETVNELTLNLEVGPISMTKWQLFLQIDQSFQIHRSYGSMLEGEADELKVRVFLDAAACWLSVVLKPTWLIMFINMTRKFWWKLFGVCLFHYKELMF